MVGVVRAYICVVCHCGGGDVVGGGVREVVVALMSGVGEGGEGDGGGGPGHQSRGWGVIGGSQVAAWHASDDWFSDTFFTEHIQWLGQEVIKFVHHQLRPKPTKQTKQAAPLLFVWPGSPPHLLLPDEDPQSTL